MAENLAPNPRSGGLTAGKFAWPPIVIGTSELSLRISRSVGRGELRRIGSRLYTPNRTEAPEVLVRRHLIEVAGGFFPGAVVADRSALTRGYVAGSTLFLAHPGAARDLTLPGLTIRARTGLGPLGPDHRFGGAELYLSCAERALVENQLPSRLRGDVRRRMSQAEVEEYLDRVLRVQGQKRLVEILDLIPGVAAELGLRDEGERARAIVRGFLGSHSIDPRSGVLRARQRGRPYDADRLQLCEVLVDTLLQHPHEPRPADPAGQPELPFFDAYFSNYIEGTEFEVDEARRIATGGEIPAGRPEDAHDILSTYLIVSDLDGMRRTPHSGEELLELLRERHGKLMAFRPEKHPGGFKEVDNRAGATRFVSHELVVGTLTEGFSVGAPLISPFDRAAFISFLVSEVHPFDDGNGRMARILLNSELTAGAEQRILIPTGYRENYLQALRALSHNGRAEPLCSVLEWAQRYAAQIDWADFGRAREMLERTNAMLTSTEIDRRGLRLRLPSDVRGMEPIWEAEVGVPSDGGLSVV